MFYCSLVVPNLAELFQTFGNLCVFWYWYQVGIFDREIENALAAIVADTVHGATHIASFALNAFCAAVDRYQVSALLCYELSHSCSHFAVYSAATVF